MNSYTSPPATLDKYGNSKGWKQQKLDDIREYHAELINRLGIAPIDFNMKMPFYDSKGNFVVGIFASEFRRKNGFYFELVTRNLDPAETDRKVYRVPFNEHFNEEYELNEKGSYLVPLDELPVANPKVNFSSRTSSQPQNQQLNLVPEVAAYRAPGPMEDAPYAEMTIRDFFAIQTGKPVSSKNWLNDLIKTASK